MALSQDEKAMNIYARLSKSEKQQLLDKARRASSHEEMQSLVSNIRSQG